MADIGNGFTGAPGGGGRLDLSDVLVSSSNTDGGIFKAGTSTLKVASATASMKFESAYYNATAVTGEAIATYKRLYVAGAGAEGICGRFYTSVQDVAAANARGAHISLSFGASGTVTGIGTALETTLHIPNTAAQTGTLSSIKAAINSDGATSDPAGARLSVFNVVNQGNATGMADVDTDCALFDFQGFAVTTGLMIYDSTGSAPANTNGSIKIRLPSGASAYLMYYDQQAA